MISIGLCVLYLQDASLGNEPLSHSYVVGQYCGRKVGRLARPHTMVSKVNLQGGHDTNARERDSSPHSDQHLIAVDLCWWV